MGFERYLLIAAFWMVPVIGIFDWTRGPNCYLFTGKDQNGVDVDGLFIPVKKAYDMWANGGEFMVNDSGSYTPIPDGTMKAGLYWEDVVGLITFVSLEGTGKQAKIKVLVDRLKEGNAVISYKVNEIIYWTWHVWVTDDPTNGSTHHHGFEKDQYGNLVTDWKWMDRNLGATNEKLTGHDWYRTKGLQYQWGRKDPFPVSKIRGEAGTFVPGIAQKPIIPVKFRGNVQPPDAIGISHNTGFDSPNGNIRYTINNPIHLVVPPVYIYKIGETVIDNGENYYKQGPNPYKWAHSDVTAWFSKKKMRNYDKNDFKKTVFYDLWGDTRGGKWSNFNTRVVDVAEESKRYSMKSPYDPCPHGWRVPSYYSSVNSEQHASPWGKKLKPAVSEFTPNAPSADYPGIKIYPSLGFDLTGVSDRNLGYIPVNADIISAIHPSQFLTGRLAKREMQEYAVAGSIAEEVFSSIRTVMAFGGARRERERYVENLSAARQINIKKAFFSGLGFGMLWFFIYASYSLAFWFGVGLVIREEETGYTAGSHVHCILLCNDGIF